MTFVEKVIVNVNNDERRRGLDRQVQLLTNLALKVKEGKDQSQSYIGRTFRWRCLDEISGIDENISRHEM